LPYKPGALHPVASAPFEALMCFCPFGLWPKRQPTRLRVAVDFKTPSKARYKQIKAKAFSTLNEKLDLFNTPNLLQCGKIYKATCLFQMI
jgi:hypothetical protein